MNKYKEVLDEILGRILSIKLEAISILMLAGKEDIIKLGMVLVTKKI